MCNAVRLVSAILCGLVLAIVFGLIVWFHRLAAVFSTAVIPSVLAMTTCVAFL